MYQMIALEKHNSFEIINDEESVRFRTTEIVM